MSWPLNVNKIKNPCGEVYISQMHEWGNFINPIKINTMIKYHIVIKFKDPSKDYSFASFYNDINDAHRSLEYYNRERENGDDFHFEVEECNQNNNDVFENEGLW